MNPNLVTTTEAVDLAFYVIFGISGLFLVGIILTMLWFVWRYNRKRQPVPLSQNDQNIPLEIAWTVIPTILVMVMFWYGWEGYLSLRRVPDNALPIHASARMWSWLFTYENDKTADKLYVPVNQPVRIELEAEDVLHAFYVPAFRVKRDMVPGMPTYAWFVAEKPGSYDLFCAEYCGVGHADMVTTVEALPPDEFQAWLEQKPAAEDAGKALLQKHGCLGCHSLDGSRMVGPTFQGLAGRQAMVMVDGKEKQVAVDAAYLERAILEPEAEIVKGYPAAMPSYAGRIPEEELSTIVDYLLTLNGGSEPAAEQAPDQAGSGTGMTEKAQTEEQQEPAEEEQPATPRQEAPESAASPAARGKSLAEQQGCLGCHSLDGSRKVGPSFKDLFGSSRTVTVDGEEQQVTADADYLKRSITHPNEAVVKGYPGAMPPYSNLSQEQLDDLIAWLKSLQ